ncbi:DUF1212-domain-containing protein [Auriscalpium vulgare]|uniref:DUF1212-domain-containing protein n=1 Tax=Auriscalpium vulgare TaxID=40419 RepID=A0ACB8S9H3_9AGAM|nr:DUF1212-domain-containing protein [Auriscalpium vulgare]
MPGLDTSSVMDEPLPSPPFQNYSMTPTSDQPRTPFPRDVPSEEHTPYVSPSGHNSISQSHEGQHRARMLSRIGPLDTGGSTAPRPSIPPESSGIPPILRPNQPLNPASSLLGGGKAAALDGNPVKRRQPYFRREYPSLLSGGGSDEEVEEKPDLDDDVFVDSSEDDSDDAALGFILRERKVHRAIRKHPETKLNRQKFVLALAKALLTFGAPSHRIEAQLFSASKILGVQASFVYLPNLILVSFTDGDTRTSELHFVRSSGRIALTALTKIHDLFRAVLRDDVSCRQGIMILEKIVKAPPLYPLFTRCLLAFVCASIICPLAFGGSFIDMWISGACACVLQYLGLQSASKSAIYANVYEISVSIIVSFLARALSCIPGRIFCYTAISSAGVVLILPGFTILISALELTSRNILCGSVRLVYAIIYTFFLGFGLTIGSDFYLVVNRKAHDALELMNNPTPTYIHGAFTDFNGTTQTFAGTFGFADATNSLHIMKSCYRDPAFPWYRQPFPWWTMFFLVPLYSMCSSLSNLQSLHSSRLFVMVLFSCCSYAANRAANLVLSDRGDIASAAGALVIGLLGNFYSRWSRGTAFTSMVTGVLFLVPSGLAQDGGLTGNYNSSVQQYYSSFTLGMRMIQVAVGVTIGLFASQTIIYAVGSRKNAGHMAF